MPNQNALACEKARRNWQMWRRRLRQHCWRGRRLQEGGRAEHDEDQSLSRRGACRRTSREHCRLTRRREKVAAIEARLWVRVRAGAEMASGPVS